jgi:hypothetical protein
MDVAVSSREATPMSNEDTTPKSSLPLPKYERLLLAEEQKMADIEKPHHHDVLCGRGYVSPFLNFWCAGRIPKFLSVRRLAIFPVYCLSTSFKTW